MSDSKASRVFLVTACLAVAWGAWLKLNEPKAPEAQSEWVIRGGKLVDRETSEPFQGVRQVPFDGVESVIQWEYHYVDGVLHGSATEYFAGPSKSVRSRATYVDGKRQGSVTTYHTNGVVETVATAVDGLVSGLVTTYNRDGTVGERRVFEQGLPCDTPAISVAPLLALAPVAAPDELDPEPVEPRPRPMLDAQGEAYTGTQVGTFFGGAKAFEHAFSGGLPDGMQRGWNPVGEPEYERPYLGGKENGTWKVWGDGGQLLSEKTFSHGRQIGSAKSWFPGGQLREESQFVHGAEHGTHTEFDEAGKRRRATTFDHGIQTGLEEWDPQGQLVKQQAQPLGGGASLTVEPGDQPLTRSVAVEDLPPDLEGEALIRCRYRLSTDAAEVPADAARGFKISLLHDGIAREFNELNGELGGWRTAEWLATITPGEALALQVEAPPGSLQIDVAGIAYTDGAE